MDFAHTAMSASPDTPTAHIPSQPIKVLRSRPAAEATDQRWSAAEIEALFELPFNDLLFQAQQVHRAHAAPNEVGLATLLSIKTRGMPRGLRLLPAVGALRHRCRGRQTHGGRRRT